MTTISVNPELCTGCRTCIDLCPYFILTMNNTTGNPAADPLLAAACCHCGHCMAVCPQGAITVRYDNGRPAALECEEEPVTPGQIARHFMMRRSVRHYKPETVPRETLNAVLEIVRYAPSGMNGQPVHWTVIRDPGAVRDLAGVVIAWARDSVKNQPMHPLAPILPMIIGKWESGRDLICHGAPALVIAHGPKDNPNLSIDSVIAMTHLDLAAPAFGLGTCWAGFVQIAADASPDVARALQLPENHRSFCAMMVGYPKFPFPRVPQRDALRVTWR
ncbi:nitroreductase family protein [Methanoregula sp.]|uniref:nitroreductase family protein n=1 Tax=Methanoregula sp. TaxID=2052170 RepID=UPI0025D1374B|nr:nitroreductase family protein [Methanoregula sp.]